MRTTSSDRNDRHLPSFVSREVQAFLRCGDPAHGFAWLRCPAGHHHRLVPFSCKGRGFCTSCGGRRMATRALAWTDRLLPRVAVRQLVLTVPWPRRCLLARRSVLARAVLRCALRVVTRWLRARGGPAARTGAPGGVTVIQRFGSALNLNLHFHVLLLDGLFVVGPSGAPLRFQRTCRWTQDDVDRLVVDIASRGIRRLWRLPRDPDGEIQGAVERLDEPALGLMFPIPALSRREKVSAREGRRVWRWTWGRPA